MELILCTRHNLRFLIDTYCIECGRSLVRHQWDQTMNYKIVSLAH